MYIYRITTHGTSRVAVFPIYNRLTHWPDCLASCTRVSSAHKARQRHRRSHWFTPPSPLAHISINPHNHSLYKYQHPAPPHFSSHCFPPRILTLMDPSATTTTTNTDTNTLLRPVLGGGGREGAVLPSAGQGSRRISLQDRIVARLFWL